jgi:hypothetical protein
VKARRMQASGIGLPSARCPHSSYPHGRPAEPITDQQRTTGHLMNNGRTPEARFQLPPDHLEITPDVGKRCPYQDVHRTSQTHEQQQPTTGNTPQQPRTPRSHRFGGRNRAVASSIQGCGRSANRRKRARLSRDLNSALECEWSQPSRSEVVAVACTLSTGMQRKSRR